MPGATEEIVTTLCASHCGGSCVLKLHVRDGVITRIETDDGEEPQLRACLRGRAYRQRVYDQNRILYPLKRVGARGEGKLARISWDEALDTIAGEIIRVRDTHGPASIHYLPLGGDLGNVNTPSQMARVLALAGGFTPSWGLTSFQSAMYGQQISYGTLRTGNTRDDLVNARLIIMWGWNPTSAITGVNTNWFLARAREAGAKIVAIDPRYTDSAAAFAHQWIPIRPATDGAMHLAMAYVMLAEGLQDQRFLDTYTVGFDQFRDHVTGAEDGVVKTPQWAEAITGVPAETIATLAREYATIKPAALIAGIAPGRTANGDQYHRTAVALAAMTGNVGVHGGDAGASSWESIVGGFRYQMDGHVYVERLARNVVDEQGAARPKGSSPGYKASRVHRCDVADFIEQGKAGGFPADCKLLAIVNFSYVNAVPNVNKIVRALKSDKLEFMFVQEQVLAPTTRFADIVLPSNTYMERTDFANGVGLAFYGMQPKAIEPLGESKSHTEIATLLAQRLGLSDAGNRTEEDWVREMVSQSEIPDFEEFKRKSIYRIPLSEPAVAFKEQIEDPANHSFPTRSGKIEIYSQRLADLNHPELAPIPKYVEAREGWNDPLRAKYPLQMISTHMKRRANNQFENVPWLRELEPQAALINTVDAEARGIKDGDEIRIFNDRGVTIIPAKVTERIMPGVVDLPHGAWYAPDDKGIDRGGCANVLTSEVCSPGGGFAYNSCLVEIQRV
jgi:anaerobic dimethyl sulfoxide reductase subunit A